MVNLHICQDNPKLAEKRISKLSSYLVWGRLDVGIVVNKDRVEIIVSERIKASITTDIML